MQSGFGNIAEFAITILALRANLPEVVKIAIVGSLLGNAVLLGGLAGLLPLDPRRLRRDAVLRPAPLLGHHDAQHHRVRADGDPQRARATCSRGDRQGVSLAAGIALTVVGVFFILMELRAPHMPAASRTRRRPSKLSFREGSSTSASAA